MMFEQNNSFTVPSIVREEGDVVLHRAEFDDFIKYQIVIERYAMTNGARASKTKSISTLNNFFSGSEGLTFLPRGGLRICLRSRPIDRSESCGIPKRREGRNTWEASGCTTRGRFAPRIRAEKMFGNQEKGGMEGRKEGRTQGSGGNGRPFGNCVSRTTIHRFDRRVFLLPP